MTRWNVRCRSPHIPVESSYERRHDGEIPLQVLVNHVGYELGGPKRFVCLSSENLGPSGRFEVVDGTGRTLMEGAASRLEPAGSAGPWHYRGDFSAFGEAGGDFQVQFEAAGRIATSRRFGVGSSILRRLAMPLVVQFLRSRRFGRAGYRGTDEWTPPGVLEDDEHFHDTGGGWFDVPAVAATSMRTGARVMWGLLLAHRYTGRRPGRGSGAGQGGRSGRQGEAPEPRDPQAIDELRRGADWLKRLVIGYPGSGRIVSLIGPGGKLRFLGRETGPGNAREPHMALTAGYLAAKISEALADNDLLLRGERFWEEYHEGLGGIESREAASAMLLSEAALHVATLQPRYLAAAERRVTALLGEVGREPEDDSREPDPEKLRAWERPGASLPVAALAEFAGSLPDHPLTPRAKEVVGRFLDARVEAAKEDPFGLVPHTGEVPAEDPAMLRAEEAWQALAAGRVTSRPAYVELATNAINWILGLNAEDTCLLVGADARGAEGWEAAPLEREVEGAILSSPGAEAASARTAAAAAFLMALALV